MEIQADLKNTVIMITHDVDEAVLLSDRIVMMTNGPAATIGEILRVELERPRNRVQLADDEQYNHYRHEVLQFLYERQRNPADAAGEESKESSTGEASNEISETEEKKSPAMHLIKSGNSDEAA